MRTAMTPWAVALAAAFVLATFGPAEAEGTAKAEALGEGMMLGGNDLSKLSFLMDDSNAATLKALLSTIQDGQAAAAAAPKPGKDGVAGVNGQPGAAGPKGDFGP